jgi:hypothetical protein
VTTPVGAAPAALGAKAAMQHSASSRRLAGLPPRAPAKSLDRNRMAP